MESTKTLDGNIGSEITSNIKRDYMKTADKITDTALEAKSTANNAIKDVQAYCRKNPGVAMAIAAGVGAAVSLALLKAFQHKESSSEKIVSDLFRKAEKAWNQLKSGVEPAVKNIKESVGI